MAPSPLVRAQSRRAGIRLFILSDVITQFGAGMVLSASAWYVFSESHSNSLVAGAASVNTVSGVLVSIVAGTVVDRFRPKSVALASHVVRIALIALPLALFSAFGFHPVFAFILALNNGIGWNLYFPASKAIIRQLADGDGTVGVNSAAEVSMQVGLFSSGAVAGLVYRSVGFNPILVASVVAFVIGIGILGLVRMPERPAADTGEGESFARTFRSGFSYLRENPRVLVLSLVLFSPFVVAGVFAAALPGYVKTDLGATSVDYGVIDMAWGVGACAAGVAMVRLTRRVRSSAVVSAGLVALGVYGLAMVANASVGVAIGFTVLAGFSAAATRIVLYSEVMAVVPVEYLGRVIALGNLAGLLLQTVLAQSAGALMDLTGPRYGFLLVALIGALAVAAYGGARRGARTAPERVSAET
ncbi:MFS transporter [Sphaerisporangium sp. NPDC004334]